MDANEADVWWLIVLRKHENELVNWKKDYKPIVTTPQNLLTEKHIHKLQIIKCKCELSLYMLDTNNRRRKGHIFSLQTKLVLL